MFSFFIKLPLRVILPSIIIGMAVIATVATGGTGYFMSRSAIHEEANAKLSALAEARKIIVK